jgi:hypothetical protein
MRNARIVGADKNYMLTKIIKNVLKLCSIAAAGRVSPAQSTLFNPFLDFFHLNSLPTTGNLASMPLMCSRLTTTTA